MTDATSEDVRIHSLSPPALQRQMSGQPTPRNNGRRDSPPSGASSSRSKKLVELGVDERQDSVTTYIVSVPKGRKIKKRHLRYGNVREVKSTDTLDELLQNISEIERSTEAIAQNVQNITVNIGSCCAAFKTCFAARDVDAKVETKIDTRLNTKIDAKTGDLVQKKNVLDTTDK